MSAPSTSAQRPTEVDPPRPRLVVLLSLAPPDGTTKFVDQVVRSAPPESTFRYFSWRRALVGRYDVAHLHWPEFLLRSRVRPVRLVRTALFLLFLARLRLTRTPVVRTVHNLTPHDPGTPLERRLLAALTRRVTVFVVLNDRTPVPSGRPRVLIPHGHYVDALPHDGAAAVPGTLLFLGRVEAYKNVDGLIRTFGDLPDPGVRLRVVGRASAALAARLTAAARGDDRVSLHFAFVPDAELVREVRSAQLVVLPYLEMHNSGVLWVALSLGRPVLVPRTPANQLVADEVGAPWVQQFDGPLTAGCLQQALAAAAEVPDGPPPVLAGRSWDVVGESYYRAYALAVTAGAGR